MRKRAYTLEPTLDNYCRYMNPRFFAEREFFGGIISAVDAFLKQSEFELLSINIPQSGGKSYFASLLSTWLIGIDPHISILRINSTQGRADDITKGLSVIMGSDKYRMFFPTAPPITINNTKEVWLYGNWNASYRGVGADVSTMSMRANLLLIDDIYNDFPDAVNLRVNKRLQNKWLTEWQGRLEGSHMKVISIGTRYSKADFYAYLEKTLKSAPPVRIPALIDGKSFCEYVRTTERFLQIERTQPVDLWNAIFMQNPTAEGQVAIFEGYEFERANVDGLTFDQTIAVVDPSFGVGADYFACGIFGLHGRKPVLIDCIYQAKIEVPEYLTFIDKHKPQVVYIERNGVGGMWIRELIKLNRNTGLAPFDSKGDKYTRIYAQADRVKQVLFSDAIPEQCFQELAAYPDVEHDDFVDMLASACNLISTLHFNF